MESLAALFDKRFVRWRVRLTATRVARKRGKIIKAGWVIWYLFGSDERGDFLDYYACHRMTSDDFVRIYADGHHEELPCLRQMYLVTGDPLEDDKIEAEFMAWNEEVSGMLQEKGFRL
jgi:hypothetical protein